MQVDQTFIDFAPAGCVAPGSGNIGLNAVDGELLRRHAPLTRAAGGRHAFNASATQTIHARLAVSRV
jgi:hypothetical protein